MIRRATLYLTLCALAAIGPGAALVRAAAVEKSSAQAPRSGTTYSGLTAEKERVTLRISRKTIEIVAWRFDCRPEITGITSLQSLQLRRSEEGYRFKISTGGIVSYSDESPDENARIAFRGQFSRTAKTVTGLFRVKTPRCGDSGYVKWTARR